MFRDPLFDPQPGDAIKLYGVRIAVVDRTPRKVHVENSFSPKNRVMPLVYTLSQWRKEVKGAKIVDISPYPMRFYMEGNNGGDYIQLEQVSEDTVHLKVGHCCVVIFDHIVPVEFLTSILSQVGGEAAPNIRDDIAVKMMEKHCDFSGLFKKELIDKIKRTSWVIG